MAESAWIKICGITCVDDAIAAFDCGASAVGLNFVPASKRWVDDATARRIIFEVAKRGEIVGVVANQPSGRLQQLRELGLDWLQLHGTESPNELLLAQPRAYKAIGVSCAEDVELALAYGGERLLLDAKVTGALGGTGQSFDWRLAQAAAASRKVILAGGLNVQNVSQAVRALSPWGIDVASGTETEDPRRKSAALMAAFVTQARSAWH